MAVPPFEASSISRSITSAAESDAGVASDRRIIQEFSAEAALAQAIQRYNSHKHDSLGRLLDAKLSEYQGQKSSEDGWQKLIVPIEQMFLNLQAVTKEVCNITKELHNMRTQLSWLQSYHYQALYENHNKVHPTNNGTQYPNPEQPLGSSGFGYVSRYLPQ